MAANRSSSSSLPLLPHRSGSSSSSGNGGNRSILAPIKTHSQSQSRQQQQQQHAVGVNSGAAAVISPMAASPSPISHSRSKPASPVLTAAPAAASTDLELVNDSFTLEGHRSTSRPAVSLGRAGRELPSSHTRSDPSSSNPRFAHELQQQHSQHHQQGLHLYAQSYGGGISRPSSGTSGPRSPIPSPSPSASAERPSSPLSAAGHTRSRTRHRNASVHSPLLYGSANKEEVDRNSSAASISSGGSGHFHGHPRSDSYQYHGHSYSPSPGSLVGQFFARWKANLGFGTGEWADPHDPTRWAVPVRLKAYVPLLIWVLVSVVMAGIVGIWHSEVFSFLDSLSVYLKSQGLFGNFILFLCIFATTFPPLPLYSTFIFLAGYSFGLLEGFLVSYAAALSGAVVVFLLSKRCFKARMVHLLDCSPGLKKVVRAVERRPKLLFLIRLSPYPYNVMNVLLASSQTLSFSCYFWCTAISLLKLIVHCSVGTTIRSFAESSGAGAGAATGDATEEEIEAERQGQRLKALAGAVGVALCVGKCFALRTATLSFRKLTVHSLQASSSTC